MFRAFAALADRYPDYTLTIYGDGELRGYLEDLAVQLGIADRVAMPGLIYASTCPDILPALLPPPIPQALFV